MERKIIQIIIRLYNIIRGIIALSILIISGSDLYSMMKDPLIYERVYLGDFLGKYSFESLFELRLFRLSEAVFAIGYLLLVILYSSYLKDNIFIMWFLRVIDVLVIIYIANYLLYIY